MLSGARPLSIALRCISKTVANALIFCVLYDFVAPVYFFLPDVTYERSRGFGAEPVTYFLFTS